MTAGAFKDIEKLEDDLWEAADNLRANSKLSSNAYFLAVPGVIFLRHGEFGTLAGREHRGCFGKSSGGCGLDHPGRQIPRKPQVTARHLPRLRLAEAGIKHRYEEFDDDHSDIDYRMDISLPFLYRVLSRIFVTTIC